MDFIRRRWLGAVVLASFALALFSMFNFTHQVTTLLCGTATFFLLVWLFRGVVRGMGRAWRHGAKTP